MTTIPKPEPLFKNADELHEALIDYAKQALEQALRSKIDGLRIEESIGGDPVFILNETKLAKVFAEEAKERMAQIAGALWMERENDAEDALAGRVVIDGIPLTSVEEAIYGAAFAEMWTASASPLTFGTVREALALRADMCEGHASIAVRGHRRSL